MEADEENRLKQSLEANMELIEVQKALGKKEDPRLVAQTEELQDQLLHQEGSLQDVEDYKQAQASGETLSLRDQPFQSLKSDGSGQELVENAAPLDVETINRDSELSVRENRRLGASGAWRIV